MVAWVMHAHEWAIPSGAIRPLKRREYERLVDFGAFTSERVELLYGRIVAMSPQSGPHATAIRRCSQWLVRVLGDRAVVSVQLPLAASDESEPAPGIAVLDGTDYVDDHPTSALLVIEVADSSRATDLTVKMSIYAAMGIGDYWVLDVDRRELVVHRDPAGDRYRQVVTHGADARLALLAFPDATASVAELLPPR